MFATSNILYFYAEGEQRPHKCYQKQQEMEVEASSEERRFSEETNNPTAHSGGIWMPEDDGTVEGPKTILSTSRVELFP